MKAPALLHLAVKAARLDRKGSPGDHRLYHIGAAGERQDGVIVIARNGCATEPEPMHHAEARLLRKLGFGGVVYVARVTAEGFWAAARPCASCRRLLRAKGVRRVYYTMPGGYRLECL